MPIEFGPPSTPTKRSVFNHDCAACAPNRGPASACLLLRRSDMPQPTKLRGLRLGYEQQQQRPQRKAQDER
jgi:hypothetical protein